MVNPVYSLNPNEIESAAKEFVSSLGEGYEFKFIEESEFRKRIEISCGRDTGILFYYIKKGQVSFSISGKTKLNPQCEACKQHIIQETKIELIEGKSVTLSNVEEENFLAVKDVLSESGYHVEDKEVHDPNIKFTCKVSGKYKDELFINYYKNKTLLTQGRITPLFLDFTIQFIPLLTSNDTIEELKSLLSITNSVDAKIIEGDLNKHILQKYDKIEGKLAMFLNTSLLLINNAVLKLPDYSCHCFSALKALEGIIKKRISEEVGFDFDSFKDFFTPENHSRKFILKPEKEILFTNQLTRESLENAYSYLNSTRHPLFHTDNMVESTRIITFDESVEITKECLKLINNLCRNWD